MQSNPKTIIEIGPGTGFFTSLLEQKVSKIICIEKDDTMAANINLFYKDVTLIHEDVLNIDFSKLMKEYFLLPEETIIYGSLPYNISKPIIDKLISTSNLAHTFYFIIQKEVAEKYTAKQSDCNYLSVVTQIVATPKILLSINPESFRPKPKVNSSLIQFTQRSDYIALKEGQYNKFKIFIHKCFTKPNKTLKNNLNIKTADSLVEKYLGKRPFELSNEDFIELFYKLN